MVTENRILFPIALYFLQLLFVDRGLADNSGFPHVNSDASAVDIFLVTIDQGEEVYSRGGHLILRLRDNLKNIDYAYDWGIFDFSEPWFGFRFFQGTLKYTVDIEKFNEKISYYQKYEKRSIYQQKLNLSASQKLRVLDRIAWWLKPENILYKYNMRFLSCATIIRDIVDESVGGNLKHHFESKEEIETFRPYMLRWVSPWPYFYIALDILLNDTIDQKENLWIKMYRPAETRFILNTAPQFSDSSEAIPESHLLEGEQTLFKGLDRTEVSTKAYLYILPVLVCLLISLVIVFRKREVSSVVSQKPVKLFMGILSIVFGVISSALGTVMITAWLLSEHRELSHNANLLLFWPLDVWLCFIGWQWMRGREFTLTSKAKKFWKIYLISHFVALTLLVGGWSFDIIDQDVSRALGFLAPFLTGLLLAINQSIKEPKNLAPVIPLNVKKQSTKRKHRKIAA